MGRNIVKDSKGRFVNAANPRAETTAQGNLRQVHNLKRVFLESISDEECLTIKKCLYELCTQTQDKKTQLAAIALWYNRVLGRATQEVNIRAETMNTNVAIDYSKLSDDDLETLVRLNEKYAEPTMIENATCRVIE